MAGSVAKERVRHQAGGRPGAAIGVCVASESPRRMTLVTGGDQSVSQFDLPGGKPEGQ